uniref:Protein inscuteable homologue C-terminal domain-containing protein n=1 Tax=Anopheles atroparvus TaxID=41427 RepID=A0AAG5DH47_ANOAO
MSRSNFQRSQSKVWFGNEPEGGSFGGIIGGAFAGFRPYGAGAGGYQYHGFGGAPLLSSRSGYPSFHDLEEEDELIEEQQPEQQEEQEQRHQQKQQPARNNEWAEANRQGSPASHKSQDSGFSDTETSPHMVGGHSKGHVSLSINDSQTTSSGEKLTPKRSVNEELLFQRSPSLNSGAPTPPTVIRRPVTKEIETGQPSTTNGRRLSFSEPSPTSASIEANGESSFREADRAVEGATRSGGSISLKRGRVITKNSRVKRNLNEQLSHSSEEMISLDGSELSEMLNQTNSPAGQQVNVDGCESGSFAVPRTPKGILKGSSTASSGSDANNNLNQEEAFKREGRELPTYAQLYPAGTSTPIKHQSKLYRSLPLSPTRRTAESPRVAQHTSRTSPTGSTVTVVENFYDEPDQIRDSLLHSTTASESGFSYTIYDNPLLNGHMPAVQSWLDGLRFGCQSEVMSILQTKSIAAEAGRTTRMTSAVAVKIIRHLQTKVTTLQGAFERVEKLFAAIKRYQAQQDNEDDEEDEKEIYQKVAPFVHGLASDIYEFVQKQKGNDYFGREPAEKDDRRKFLENAQSLVDMTVDLRASAANAEDFDYRSVEEEVQIVKRYFLITVRLIFKNLVKVIVDTVEAARCDLILRSNLSYVAMLSNLDYSGLASLNDAFIANYTVRALLLVCVESKFSSIRALALRALATVCSTTETIRQLERADGLEVLRDILVVDQQQPGGTNERTEPELREAVSVLTQITAPWHGEEHRLEGLKQHVHSIVEAITEIIERTTCCQTLLLGSACLNNMTRIEPTAVYSLMSQDTVGKLKTAIEQRGPGTSIFLYEQFTSMLYNMSANWKSHHHLAGRPLVSFLVAVFSQKFYEKLPSRTESEAQRKTIKNILHVLSRLMSGGCLAASSPATLELLESTLVPVFARIERTLDGKSEHYRDISSINRWFNESVTSRHGSPPTVTVAEPMNGRSTVAPHITRLTVGRDPVNGGAVIMLDKNRQESYV